MRVKKIMFYLNFKNMIAKIIPSDSFFHKHILLVKLPEISKKCILLISIIKLEKVLTRICARL